MTPFQKKFPNATKDTVFEVIDSGAAPVIEIGDVCTLCHDDDSDCPQFHFPKKDLDHYLVIDWIKIHNPINQGDLVDVARGDKKWLTKPRTYIADTHDFLNSDVAGQVGARYLTLNHETGAAGFYCQVRPHNPNQELTLDDGTVLSIPPKKIEKLKKRFAK